jgi:hypothetical protein
MNSGNKKSRPVAPPVYRPQPVPKVLQAKSSSKGDQAGRKSVAPPVYRPEAKKIVQPKAVSPQRKSPAGPPVYRPNQKEIAQLQTAATTKKSFGNRSEVRSSTTRNAGTAAIQRKLSQPGKTAAPAARGNMAIVHRSSVVQRARDMLKYEQNYVLVPDINMDAYSQHVKMRTRHFFAVILGAVLEMRNQPKGVVGPGMFTNIAKAQEAKGFRLGPEPENKLDAAHLMNTTLVPNSFPNQNAKVEELYRSSAATTTQFQKANVGPDKQIDSQQTATKNTMLSAIKPTTVVDQNFVKAYVIDYLNSLSGALSVPLPEPEGVLSQARAAAMRAIKDDLQKIDDVVSDIVRELKL